MTEIKVTDEWLYRYMPIVDEAIIRTLENETDYDYEFSDRFDRKMKRLIRKEKHMDIRKAAQKAGRRVAVFLAAILAVTFAVTMSVEAYRTKFFERVETIFEDYFVYSYIVDYEEEFKPAKPEYIPDGYWLEEEDGSANMLFLIYENDSGRQFALVQQLVSDGTAITFDSEYDYAEQIDLAEDPVTLHRYFDGTVCAYMEYENSVYILNAVDLDNEEIEKIYESWIKN